MARISLRTIKKFILGVNFFLLVPIKKIQGKIGGFKMELFKILSEDYNYYEDDEKRPTIEERLEAMKKDIIALFIGIAVFTAIVFFVNERNVNSDRVSNGVNEVDSIPTIEMVMPAEMDSLGLT